MDSIKGIDGVSVVVADNASTDGSLELLQEQFPTVATIALDRNYGFAEGYNMALKQVQTDNYLLLNSDVEVSPDWFTPLAQWMDLHPDCGICGPLLHQTQNREMFEYAGAAGGYLDRYCYPFCRGRVMQRLEADNGQYSTPQDVFWVSGAALMIRSRLFHGLGGFCADFFAHMEEIDLCWRARLDGWKVSIVPRSVVYHVGGGTLPQGSARKLFYNYRNNLLMMHRCLPRTFALESAYNLLGRYIVPDEGPDMFHNCEVMYSNELDSSMHNAILESSAQLGILRTKRLIFVRMVLDGLSAGVYLVTGKADCAAAVIKAHKDFRRLRKKTSHNKLKGFMRKALSGERGDIARTMLSDRDYTVNKGGKFFCIKGVWSKWIVLQSIFKKETIFAEIKEIL